MPSNNPQVASALIEGILLLEDDYCSLEELVHISGFTAEEVQQALQLLSERYHNEAHGIEISHTESGYFIVPKQNIWRAIAPAYKKRHTATLSKASLETLTIIAYMQPITRATIEGIRGSNSESSIRLLLKQNIILIRGALKAPGNPPLYSTTDRFLRLFNLSSLKELPQLESKDAQQFQPKE